MDGVKGGIKRFTAVDGEGIPIERASLVPPTATTRRSWLPPSNTLQSR